MEIKDIIDYIEKTPANTNPNVLETMLEEFGGGITPTGTINITQNGTFDVTDYASAKVNVSQNIEFFTLTIEDYIFQWNQWDESYAFINGWTWADLIASGQNEVVAIDVETGEPVCWRLMNIEDKVWIGIGSEGQMEYERQQLEYDGDTISVNSRLVASRYYGIMFGSNCLVAGTKIATENSTKNVEDIKVGDIVKSIDPETLAFKTAEVAKVRNSYVPHEHMFSNKWFKYSFDDGSFFRITGKHRFFDVDTQKYEWAEDIKIGDRVYKMDGTMPKLVSVERFDEKVEYNTFWNKNHDPYFVDGFLSGNFDSPIPNIKG